MISLAAAALAGLLRAGMDEVNEPEVIVAEEKFVRADLQKTTWTAMYHWAALDACKESGNEVM